MLMRALLLFITLNAISTYNCFGMELNDAASKNNSDEAAIPLDKGLLTRIPGKIIKEGRVQEIFWESGKTSTKIDEKNDILIHLLYYEAWPKNEIPYTYAYFEPYLIQTTIQKPNIHIARRGQFRSCGNSRATRREIKEAIREKQALYWPYKQGVIIYSLEEQPKPSIVEHVKKLLDSNKNSIIITEQ